MRNDHAEPTKGRIRRRATALLLVALSLWCGTAAAQAPRGVTLTPDRLTYVVNKDLAGDRWTINVNLATFDPARIINVTGNVYRPGADSPAFIWCQVRSDSTGSLADPASVFRLSCKGAQDCTETAVACAHAGWSPIADDVSLPASFFLPALGNGASARSAAVASAARGGELLASGLGRALRAPSTTPGRPVLARGSRGTNLPPDVSNFLVNKDIGTDRWSISLNLIPASDLTAADPDRDLYPRLANRPLNVTGNVFPSGGGAPIFVFCQERDDSLGDLANLASVFRLSCLGAGPCERTATECALRDWQPIPGAQDVAIPASFFLPTLGLPASPQSDPEIVVIGRTSDGTSLATSAAASVAGLAGSDGACAEGAPCSLRAGSCADVPGTLRIQESGRCACHADHVPDACLVCGDGASGQCGGDCAYPVGSGAVARGQCLPFAAGSSQCACYATNFDSQLEVGQCGGALGVVCPGTECCADDPRDGCDPGRGDERCSGVCVDAQGCDPTTQVCGACFDQRNASGGICAGAELEPGASCCDDDLCRRTGECSCGAGTVCVENESTCCPTNVPQYCPRLDSDETDASPCILQGAECCAVGQSAFCLAPTRCPQRDEHACIDAGDVECASGAVCGGGFVCSSAGDCLPRTDVDCGNGTFCPSGTYCDGGECFFATEEDCGNGRFCSYDDDVVCSPDGAACVPLGGEYCGGGRFCGPDQLCSSDGSSCLPLRQCDNGNVCPPADTCSSDGVTCIPPGRVDCGSGINCPLGTFCGSQATCPDLGRQDCGRGTSCPPGSVCTPDGGCRVVDDGLAAGAALQAEPAAMQLLPATRSKPASKSGTHGAAKRLPRAVKH